MGLRYFTFSKVQYTDLVKKTLCFFLILCSRGVFSQTTSPKELKKEANQLFENEEYSKAYKLYSQLVANFPKDPEYNYRLGVCMIYSEPDKKKCIPYLKQSISDPKEAPPEAYFYLGKAHHINYHFDAALKHYQEFKGIGTPALQKKLQVDREIQACINGKDLLSNMSDLVVQSKKELNEADFFRSYDLKNIGGKLLVKPEDFKTAADKKKKEKSVIFLPKGGGVVYYSSYGETGETGKDIYTASKLPNGTYSKPQKLPMVNTPYDEDYPYIHPNGNSLYFASKGHNSMGGYDIFRSDFNEESNTWTTPVNLEFPINSPDDDFLFVTDSLGQTAFFSTGRQSPPGKIDVLKIKTERPPIDMVVIQGIAYGKTKEDLLASTISIKNTKNELPIGSTTAEENGEYQLEVPNGSSLLFTVESPGFKTESKKIVLPLSGTSKLYKQIISYEDGNLKITNNFDVKKSDTSYLAYLNIIEKKAKLNVNEGENKLTPKVLSSDQETVSAVATNNPSVKNDPVKSKPPINNKELLNLAKQDAVTSRKEAQQLQKDAEGALIAGQKQKKDADNSLSEARKSITAAESISDPEEKAKAIEQGQELERNAKNQQEVAVKIIGIGESMREDAKTKQREADLNEQYTRELEKVVSGKTSTESLRKLEELQNEIQLVVGKGKTSDAQLASLRADLEEKENKLESAEKESTATRITLAEIKQEISQKETELSKTKKRSAKEAIQIQIDDLKKEQTEKEREVVANEAKVKSLSEEVTVLSAGLDAAQKVATGTAVTPIAANDQPVKTDPQKIRTNENSTASTGMQKSGSSAIETDPATKQAYAVISAKNKEEAISKLDSISAKLESPYTTSTTEYADENATKLMTEAGQQIADATVRQEALLKKVQAVKQKIASGNSSEKENTEALNKEAEQLLARSQQLRTEAGKKDGAEKQNLEKQSKQLEDQANDKLIAASELSGTQNNTSYNKIRGDFKTLIDRDRVSGNDKQGGEKLAAEADLAFRQAVDIRNEAQQMTAKGAKLGNLSNAEEKESEAIVKLQQAVDLMRKSDPEFKPAAAASTNGDQLAKELKEVNEELDQLNRLKLASYEKMYEANTIEITSLQTKFTSEKTVIDSDPSLRRSRDESEKIIIDAKRLNESLPAEPVSNAKVNSVAMAVKRQQEGLVIMKKLNNDLTNAKLATNTTPDPKNETQINTQTGTEKESATPNNTAANATQPVKNVLDGVPQAKIHTTVLSQLTSPDRIPLRNQGAGTQAEQAVERLQEYEKEEKNLDLAISAGGIGGTSEELRNRATQVLMEAEGLSRSSGEEKREAETRTGEARETQLAQAEELQNESEDKSLAAAVLIQKANEAQITVNDEAITELSEKLREDNPGLLNEINELGKQISFLKIHSRNMRSEAEEQTNKSARIGALSNAEEKETQILTQQAEIMLRLKEQYPDYVVKPAIVNGDSPEILAAKKQQLRENQFRQLTNLANAYNMEFETAKNSVPQNLSPALKAIRDSAVVLNAEAKRLLITAQTVEDKNEKLAALSRAALVSNQAAEKINDLVPEGAPVAVTPTVSNNVTTAVKTASVAASASTPTSTRVTVTSPPTPTKLAVTTVSTPTPVTVTSSRTTGVSTVTAAPATTSGRNLVKIEGLEVIAGNAYSATKPIPVDAKMADGLVFRVQIGAFRTKLPDNAFRGLNPLNAESTDNGYLRYTAGNFNRIENANAVKNDLRGLGYSDAFVVAYFNGKRISLGEALAMMKNEGKTIDPNASQTAGITANVNIPRAINNPAIQEPATISSNLNDLNGLFYTIQIGVYNRQVSRQRLYNLLPVYTEAMANGLYRYTAGIYADIQKLNADKTKVVDLGITDAFVTAYIDGKRVAFGVARERQANDASIKTAQQKPIVFPAGSTALPGQTAVTTTPVKPFSNGVKGYPAATAQNGVKPNEQGVTFKVQIGAYSKEVPEDIATKFSGIKNWPVESKQLNNLYIYNIGNFSEPRFAKQLKEEAVRLGINDAFITVYRDGKKVYGSEASSLLGR